jgi:hypothetical protein
MRKEAIVEIGILTTLAFTAFPRIVVLEAKKQKSEETGIPIERLEAHHQKPLCRGGTDDPKNMKIVTLPEHAMAHYELGMNARGKEKSQNLGAVKMIVQRMTLDEVGDFNSMIARR